MEDDKLPLSGHAQRQRAQSFFRLGKLPEARVLYEQLCRDNPRDTESHYMLGLIHGQSGEFELAAEYFRRTVAIDASVVVAHRGLGEVRKAQGDYPGAETCFREALRLQPDAPDVALVLAGVLLEQEKLADAERCLRGVLRSHPRSAEALVTLGEIHHVRRQLREAIGFYRRALEIQPDLTATHYRLGVALHALGRPRDAIPHFQEALRLNPGFADAHASMAAVLAECGRTQEARAAYRRALAIQPDCLPAIVGDAALLERAGEFDAAYKRIAPLIEKGVEDSSLGVTYASLCRHLGRAEEGTQYLERLLAHPGLREGAEEQIRLTLGKNYDECGRYQEAFLQCQKANELRPARYNADAHATAIDTIIDTFGSTFLASAPRATHESHRPIFIVGMPRSGTSLVEQILASHPDVFGAGELGDITRLACEIASSTDVGPAYRCGFRGLTQGTVDRLAEKYLAHLGELDSRAARVTDKMPHNYQHMGLIAMLFPTAKVIHCVRDPRDVCLSIYFQYFAEGHTYAHDMESLGLYYRQYERLMEHWRCVLDLPILEVCYEQLVTHQEAVSKQLIEFVGLSWDDRCLAFHKTGRLVATPSYDQVRRPMYTSSVGRWRNYEWAIGPLTRALGIDD